MEANIEIDKELVDSIDYLLSVEKPHLIAEDQKSQNAFVYLKNAIKYKFNSLELELFLEKKCPDLIANVLYYIASICDNLDVEDYFKRIDSNTTKLQNLYTILELINHLLTLSVQVNLEFQRTRLIEAHFFLLSSEKFIANSLKNNMVKIFELITSNISWLSRYSDENKKNWINMNPIDLLVKISKHIKSCSASSYHAIANIADDRQIETVKEIKISLLKLVDILKLASDGFSQNINLSNEYIELLEGGVISKKKVYFVTTHLVHQDIVEILKSLYRLAVNDKHRREIYFNLKIKDDLKIVLHKANEVEIKYALRLLAQLSFNRIIAYDIMKDKDLVLYIANLMNDFSSNIDVLESKKICQILDWNLRGGVSTNSSTESVRQEHVFISYHKNSREICLKIKNQLENYNLKVSMDENDSIEAMTKAIENSCCILMCVTEKYRQSIKCQAEVQYAFKLNKPIITLTVQSDYEITSGWLGMMMDDKKLIDFTKNSFEESMKKLRNEIDLLYKLNITGNTIKYKPKESTNKLTVSSVSSPLSYNYIEVNDLKEKKDKRVQSLDESTNNTSFNSIENLTEQNITDWFKENNLNINILEILKPCNGVILKQLHDMKIRAPEFFYQSIKEDNKIDIRSIALFTHHLDKLFSGQASNK